MKRGEVHLLLQQIIIVKAMLKVDGKIWSFLGQVDRKPQLLSHLPLCCLLAVLSLQGRTRRRQIPHIGPVLLKGLSLLDEQFIFAVKNADMNCKMILSFLHRITAPMRFSRLFPVFCI